MMYILVQSICCLYVRILTSLQQMVPPFILPISQLSHVFLNKLCMPYLLIRALEYIKWTQQNMKLLILQFSGACCCLVYVSCRY